jgi:hypothetical protein
MIDYRVGLGIKIGGEFPAIVDRRRLSSSNKRRYSG